MFFVFVVRYEVILVTLHGTEISVSYNVNSISNYLVTRLEIKGKRD